jgi:hypothetical protein
MAGAGLADLWGELKVKARRLRRVVKISPIGMALARVDESVAKATCSSMMSTRHLGAVGMRVERDHRLRCGGGHRRGIALNLLFHIPLLLGAILTILDAFVVLVLLRWGVRLLEDVVYWGCDHRRDGDAAQPVFAFRIGADAAY